MARMPAVGPSPTMPTSTRPNTSVWIARPTSSTPLAGIASQAGAARLRAVSSAERQGQQGAEQRAEGADDEGGPGSGGQLAQEARLDDAPILHAQHRAVVAAILELRVAEPGIEKARVGEFADGLGQVGQWLASQRQVAIGGQRGDGQGDQQRVGEHQRQKARAAAQIARDRQVHGRAGRHGVSASAPACRWPGRRRGSVCRTNCRG